MSKNGDVVWANGVSFYRDDMFQTTAAEKRWWYSPVISDGKLFTLKELKRHDDFLWLVFNGELVDSYPEDKTTVDWENGWLAGINNAGRMLGFDTADYRSFKHALEEKEERAFAEGFGAAKESIAAQLSDLNKQISDLRHRNIELQGNKVDGDDRFNEGYAKGRVRERELVVKWIEVFSDAILQGDHCG